MSIATVNFLTGGPHSSPILDLLFVVQFTLLGFIPAAFALFDFISPQRSRRKKIVRSIKPDAKAVS